MALSRRNRMHRDLKVGQGIVASRNRLDRNLQLDRLDRTVVGRLFLAADSLAHNLAADLSDHVPSFPRPSYLHRRQPPLDPVVYLLCRWRSFPVRPFQARMVRPFRSLVGDILLDLFLVILVSA